MSSPHLLIEVGCEELPPKSLAGLAQSLLAGLSGQLDKARLSFDVAASRAYYTPRRLGLLMAEVATQQPDQSMERKGPAVSAAFDNDGQPTPAAMGFAKSVAKNVADLDTLKTDGGEWLYCRVEKRGKPLGELLYPMLEAVFASLPIAKPMRWGANDFSFIRPVHWLVIMHGADIIEGRLFGLQAGNLTQGHRVHSRGPHKIDSASDYEKVLNAAFVEADQENRKSLIKQQVIKLGKDAGGVAVIDDDLLEEVTNLVEWPRAICGSFDAEFLTVPAEALIASMQAHQKFFPVVDTGDGQLLASFIAVANLESTSFADVQKGFERVIRPRLADARFFWDQDNKTSFETWLPQLDTVVFQNKLGSVGDKSKRLAYVSKKIAEETGVDENAAEEAARLCKCDLVSQMVAEFPGLQGVMGEYYARRGGASELVSQAIGDHYLPAFSGDRLPRSAVGKIVALADRLDSLTGIFATGVRPSGNKDPFALRRAALGLIRILLASELDIGLNRLLAISTTSLHKQLPVEPPVRTELHQFIVERLKHYLRDQGYSASLVDAALDAPLNTLPDLSARLAALDTFMNHDDSAKLAAANKRIGNILRKSKIKYDGDIDEDRLVIDEEKNLFNEISGLYTELNEFFEQADYTAALTLLAGLSASIEAFFDKVLVMDDDAKIRLNRLNLLARLKGLFDRIANFALIG